MEWHGRRLPQRLHVSTMKSWLARWILRLFCVCLQFFLFVAHFLKHMWFQSLFYYIPFTTQFICLFMTAAFFGHSIWPQPLTYFVFFLCNLLDWFLQPLDFVTLDIVKRWWSVRVVEMVACFFFLSMKMS